MYSEGEMLCTDAEGRERCTRYALLKRKLNKIMEVKDMLEGERASVNKTYRVCGRVNSVDA